MTRLLDGFYRSLLYLAALFMIATLAVILLGVAGRQFNFDVPGLDAYAGYSIAAALFLAMPATLRNGDHIRVTLILNKLEGNARKLADYWCLIAASGLALYLAYFSLRLVWLSYVTNDVSPGSDATPLWIPQIAMALGSVGLALAFIEDLALKLLDQERILMPGAEMARTE
ncbi:MULTISPECIES: TRAP transporter small permease [Oxalobacteraceae]|jgi:TRAP-type C4-dicarboxylate transport system permease small subunit|uniref:TRAP transporter small permease n=1 Tax=Oxalobacteraceae TaxID=75682 RepID=UPI0010A39673|nr:MULTISPECIES: TRAP transporter small permease [Oxalobacteraceae]